MPRRPRQSLEGTVFHVVCRGVAGQLIFEDDLDRSRFVWQLNEVSERFGWRVIAWCLMGTHFHLVVECEREQLSLAVHRLNCLYAMYFNRRHERRGHLFENRFSAWVVWDESHLESTSAMCSRTPSAPGSADKPPSGSGAGQSFESISNPRRPQEPGPFEAARGTVP
jgi:REP element-mobilizing transposase RayT